MALLALAAGAGCGLYRADADPAQAARVLPERYPARHTAAPTEAVELDRYWQAFGAPALDRLVEAALAGNHDLRAAAARVRQAGFGARHAWSDRLPELDLKASVGYAAREPATVSQ